MENPDKTKMSSGTYTVTGDANFLEGWTAESLAEALRAPLGEFGIEVECKPKQFGGESYIPHTEESPDEDYVRYIVERVVCLGE